MSQRFLQIHFLTSYPATLLNRDDVGFAKRMPFGGAVRTRISSQCLKRHWRTADGQHTLRGLEVPMSVRSRVTFEEEVAKPLVEEKLDAEAVRAVTSALRDVVLATKEKADDPKKPEKAPKKSAKKGADAEAAAEKPAEEDSGTGQVTVFGRAEVEFFKGIVRELVNAGAKGDGARKAVEAWLTKERKENLLRLKMAAGLDGALFGRMVTSDLLARGDAALHVAHALTVHEEENENDYFAAVDDIAAGRRELGSGHIGTSELTSGLYYGYVVVDVPLLVSNLEGVERKEWAKADRGLAGSVVASLVHTVARVTPGAKLGSTAPHAAAHAVVVEAGDAQPRTLANAFLRPVRARTSGGLDLLGATYDAFGRYVRDLDRVYEAPTRAWVALGEDAALRDALGAENDRKSLGALAGWARKLVTE